MIKSSSSAQDKIRHAYQIQVALFLFFVVLLVVVLSTIYQGAQTLTRLDVIERERDNWQRSSDVLRSLNLSSGSVVVDLGCGSGYFVLKLSPLIGSHGQVLAVDIRRLSLAFLWVRAVLRHQQNIRIIHSQPVIPICRREP